MFEALHPLELLAGQVLFRSGEEADALYLIEEGLLEVLLTGGRLAETLGPTELLGEISLLQESPRSATVRAATDGILWRLDMDEARAIAETDAHFALGLGKVIAARLNADVNARQATLRPRVQVVVTQAGDGWAEAAGAALRAKLAQQDTLTCLYEAPWDASGEPPGSPAHVAETRLFCQTLRRHPELVLWTAPGAPSLARCLRNADRVIVLGDEHALASVMPHLADGVPLVLASTATDSAAPAELRGTLLPLLQDPTQSAIALLDELEREGKLEEALAHASVLSGLSLACRREIVAAMRIDTFLAGQPLHRAGDLGERLFFVLSGLVQERGEDGQLLEEHGPGAIFGAHGLLGPQAHTAAAAPQRDSRLAALDVQAIAQLCIRFPALRGALLELWARRADGVVHVGPSERLSLTLVCQGSTRAWRERAQAIRTALGGDTQCRVLTREEVEASCGRGATDAAPSSIQAKRVSAWLASVEEHTPTLLYLCDAASSEWTRRCLRQADHVLVLVDPEAEGSPEALLPPAGEWSAPRHLVLWWSQDIRPGGTTPWLDRLPGLPWHHIRAGDHEDLCRMLRRVRGVARGLTLGGASSRGVAHLGVAAAMADCGLSPDCVVGTSSGSLIAALLVRQLNLDVAIDATMGVLSGFRYSIENVSLPLTSMLNGKRVTRLLERCFQGALMEDMAISLRITAVDLRSGEPVVIDRGPIWRAVRASTSIPSIWPPVAVDGRLYVDGGLMDNFPFEVLRDDCRQGLTLISNLDAGYGVPYPDTPDYGAVLSGWRVLADGLLRRRWRYPQLGGVITESLVLGGRASSRNLEARIDPRHVQVARPNVPLLGIFELRDAAHGRQLVDSARREIRAQLERWRATRPPAAA
ncbi:MAG: cyclic nucleotide-binding domain-containing protein [Alphaproteobacteria bacterium]|nr:cyclic nucleotide-binding domain-containing protein [Alphaproteobacteria bacterium]MCB9796541.1 cyclic nucleotide-binding domain-containing protein [Alphaproteobacteria bacterium]